MKIAVIGDTHYGSKFCNRAAIKAFVSIAKDSGIDTVLHCGDILDGCYKHSIWDQKYRGFEEQVNDAIDSLPTGVYYEFITGNHDETFAVDSGMDVGKSIEAAFCRAGRMDLEYIGAREGNHKSVRLWHPRPSFAPATLYRYLDLLHNPKVSVACAGHWHVAAMIERPGVLGLAVPSFMDPGSSFGNSLTTPQSRIGGWIIDISKDAVIAERIYCDALHNKRAKRTRTR